MAEESGIPPCHPRITLAAGERVRNTTNITELFNLHDESQMCERELRRYGGRAWEEEPLTIGPPCSPDIISVELGVRAIIPTAINHRFLPLARFNLSVNVFSPAVDSVFARLHCIYAADGSDPYCNSLPESHMKTHGRIVWPCRGFTMRYVEFETQAPYSFAFDCFHAYAYSQYYMNVTVMPQACTLSYLVTLPQLHESLPELHQYYQTKNNTVEFKWAPMLIVDKHSSSDGVWFFFSIPKGVEWRNMILSLYDQNDVKGSLRALQEWTVPYDGSVNVAGVKWEDAEAGQYQVIAHVQRHDCSLFCKDARKCSICKATRLSFTLDRPYLKSSSVWIRRIRDITIFVLPFVIIILAATVILLGAYVYYVRRRASKQTRDVPLVSRPSVLILYSHDSEEHAKVVREVANVLSFVSSANVHYDAEDLVRPGARPTHWMVEQFDRCVRVLVVVSPSLPHILKGKKELKQISPFPDTLQSALPLISKSLTEHLTKSSPKVAFIRLSYSPPLPTHYRQLDPKMYTLPEDLALLTSFIHGIDTSASGEVTIGHETTEALEPLRRAITDTEEWMSGQPYDWIERRMKIVDRDVNARMKDHVEKIAKINNRSEMPRKTRKEYVEQDGLLAPDDHREYGDDDGEKPSTSTKERYEQYMRDHVHDSEDDDDGDFALLPPDSDSSDEEDDHRVLNNVQNRKAVTGADRPNLDDESLKSSAASHQEDHRLR